MSYIGKIQVGAGEQTLIGSTLYGVCNSAIDASAKTVPGLTSFDTVMNGITVHVRFINGNSVASGVTLAIGTTTAQTVVGNCICNANDVVAFTYHEETIEQELVKRWYVNNNVVVEEGSTNGTIKVNGQSAAVHGLGSAAYTDSTTYMPIGGGQFTGDVTFATGETLTVNAPSADGHAATKKYVDDAIDDVLGSADAMIFKGTIGANGTINTTANPPQTLPTTGYSAGWTYRVITAGTYAGQACEVGDLIIAINDVSSGNSGTDADWTVAQGNLDGTVSGPVSSTDGNVVLFDGSNGKTIKDSGLTIETSVPANAVFTDHQYTLTTGANAYTGTTTYDSTASNTKTMVSVSQGVMYLEEGITFTTTAVGTALANA